MRAEVALQALRERRRSLLWWSLGLLALVALNIAFYPSIRDDTSINDYVKDLPESLRGLFAGGELDIASPAGYLNSQVFALMAPPAMRLPVLWLQIEQQRKKPWRVAGVFGPLLLLGYLLRLFTLDQAMARVSARLGLRVAAVKMPSAEAAIDVDKPEDLELVEAILRRSARD